MPAPFAALEARLNQAVFARLSNAEAVLDHDIPVTGIFGNPYTEAFGLVAAAAPTFLLPTAAAPNVAQGQELRLTGADGEPVRYTVRSVEPDGTGMTRLTLSAAC